MTLKVENDIMDAIERNKPHLRHRFKAIVTMLKERSRGIPYLSDAYEQLRNRRSDVH
ncbi:Protein CBG27681 [Caenorhabditis briggsae]|uniref:Protein CBG27681 n=1 Tax=Caenorhabditis briggsae TaxID=6238 RepID=B6IJC6_CAEBR|nr:Protein CBG27681 [Caenorhabditis briggsae]CAR99960.1 Protein CBG27681 [Caenorhabditis briggsae]